MTVDCEIVHHMKHYVGLLSNAGCYPITGSHPSYQPLHYRSPILIRSTYITICVLLHFFLSRADSYKTFWNIRRGCWCHPHSNISYHITSKSNISVSKNGVRNSWNIKPYVWGTTEHPNYVTEGTNYRNTEP